MSTENWLVTLKNYLLRSMTFKSNVLCLLCIVVFVFKIAAQEDIKFTSLSTKDGLSSNAVRVILKDKFGLLWFGTDDGLDKFDGSHFKVYRNKIGDSTSLQSNEILSLHEDKSGNLWVGTSGGSLSLYDRKKDAFINFPASPQKNFIHHNVIRDICSDYLGKIWVIHFGGVDILDPITKKVETLTLKHDASQSTQPINGMCAYEDSKHRMWIGTSGGVFQYNPQTKAIKEFQHSATDSRSLPDWMVNDIAEDKNGNIWVGTTGGLSLLRKDEQGFINFSENSSDPEGLSSNNINSIVADGEKLWLGTSRGLNIFDINTFKSKNITFDNRNIHSLTSRDVRTVYKDNHGIYWLGLFRGGVNKYDKNLNLFNFIKSNAFDEQGLKTAIVSSFAEDKDGNVFVGSEGGGLSLFNMKTRLFQHFTIKSARKNAGPRLNILAMKKNRQGQLMIGTYSDGLFVFDPVSKKHQQLMRGKSTEDLNSNNIFCIKEDRKGNMWIGTNGDGINVLNGYNKVIVRYTPTPAAPNDVLLPVNGYIRDIEEDDDGNIWIATHGGGIAVLEPSSGKFIVYTTWNSKLPNDKIQSLLKDSHGNIWAGTFGNGLVIINSKTRQFNFLSEKDGLENNTIYAILEDQKGLIWVSTNKGISSIDTTNKNISNYNYHNGVQNNNFVHEAGLVLSTGELFFGGLEGFNYFNPKYLRKNTTVPTILITDLRINHQSVIPSDKGPIKEHISIAKTINLDYKQNFVLSFVGLNFTAPEQNQYAYKLDGFDKNWNYIGNSTSASYTNLDPGEYTFRVKASNNDGVWNNEGASIKIFVHPPFWRTTYAYILYVLAFLFLFLYLRHRGIKKLKNEFAAKQLQTRIEQERKEAERVHELDMLKLKFLTNLSHEFRTPISLILGPTDKLISQQKNESHSGELTMIRRNAKRLLNLVNQLLDFRKMEEQELRLQSSEGELISFLKELCDSFQDLSERKKIQFVFKTYIDQFYTHFDHDKIERILFNLLSNAFKFTPEGGKISLELDKLPNKSDQRTWIMIKLSDSGIGIPEDKKEKIFENFFQNQTSSSIINHGSGIGLSITKEFVKMHGGTIEVESKPDKGTTFYVHLPFVPAEVPVTIEQSDQQIIPDAEPELLKEENTSVSPLNGISELPTILLVEDSEDFRFYLKDNLRLYYKIIEAKDGKEGWTKALTHHPELIVSDVSMPYIDGIDLTKKLKSDKRTSHIPVILLTALSEEKNQKDGLETGANDYITKPFNFEILKAKIKNLLVLNNTLKNTYSKQIKVLAPEVEIESDNQKLLKDIMFYLEENLTNSQLSVEELSRHVGMSRSTLYNKILEITGQTPVEFIRSLKLDKAAVLLEKSDMNIAQIAYSVGFTTPNYFAKSFKAKFNMLPSEYINKKRKNGQATSKDKNTSGLPDIKE